MGSLAEPLVIWEFCMPESAIRACFRLRAGLGLKVCILEVNFERFFFKKKTHSWGISGGGISASVPSERLFSDAGQLVTNRRNRLGSDTIRTCICLDSWWTTDISKFQLSK